MGNVYYSFWHIVSCLWSIRRTEKKKSHFPISSFLGRHLTWKVANSVQRVTFMDHIRPERETFGTGGYPVYNSSSCWHADFHLGSSPIENGSG